MATENRIDALKNRHNELDAAIEMEAGRAFPDDLQIYAMKKEKLRIKDELEILIRH